MTEGLTMSRSSTAWSALTAVQTVRPREAKYSAYMSRPSKLSTIRTTSAEPSAVPMAHVPTSSGSRSNARRSDSNCHELPRLG